MPRDEGLDLSHGHQEVPAKPLPNAGGQTSVCAVGFPVGAGLFTWHGRMFWSRF